MPRPRETSSEGSSRSSKDAESGSGSSESASGSTGSSSDGRGGSGSSASSSARGSTNKSDRSGSFGSGKSSATFNSRRTASSSRKGRSDSSTSSSSSDDGSAEGGKGNTFKSRMKTLFKKQEEEIVEVEELGELHQRVNAKLLAEVEEYDAVPSEAASYAKPSFWDERYATDEEAAEWYHPWANLAPTLTQYMDEEDKVLICGCGNSEMSVDMYDDGFEKITNVDSSRVAIHQMSQAYQSYPMKWKSVDLTHEEFPGECFDVALDKACLDSIMCNSQKGGRTDKYLQQMDRILQPEGAFICVSFAPPEERLELLEYWDLDKPEKCLAWDVYVDAIAKPQWRQTQKKSVENDVYYIYVCIKDPNKTEQKILAKEKVKHEQEKKLAKMLGFKGRGRGRSRGMGKR